MPKKKNELSTKKTNTGVALGAPAWMNAGVKGKAKLRAEDTKMPFLRLGQKNTPQVEDRSLKINVGDWFNSLTNKNYGKNPRVILVDYKFSRVDWKAMKDGGGKRCFSLDGITAQNKDGKDAKGKPTNICGDCIFSKWDIPAKGNAPSCKEQAIYMALIEGEIDPMILSLQSTSYKAHKGLATMIRMSNVDIYGNVYVLGSIEREKKGVGKYLEATVSGDGFVKTEAEYKKVEALHNNITKGFQGTIIEDPSA